MKLTDIAVGTLVDLVVKRKEKKKTFRTKIADNTSESIQIHLPVSSLGEFNILSNDHLEIVYAGKDGVISWICKLNTLIEVGNLKYLDISSIANCEKCNRRNGYRVKYINNMLLETSQNEIFTGLTKDISILGLCIQTSHFLNELEVIDVSVIIDNFTYTEQCQVIRIGTPVNGFNVYGLRFIQGISKSYEKAINKLQHDELRKLRKTK